MMKMMRNENGGCGDDDDDGDDDDLCRACIVYYIRRQTSNMYCTYKRLNILPYINKYIQVYGWKLSIKWPPFIKPDAKWFYNY